MQDILRPLMSDLYGMARPCSCPASDKLVRGRQKEHPMAATPQSAIAVSALISVISRSTSLGSMVVAQSVLRQKWSRGQVETRFANMSPCLIGMDCAALSVGAAA